MLYSKANLCGDFRYEIGHVLHFLFRLLQRFLLLIGRLRLLRELLDAFLERGWKKEKYIILNPNASQIQPLSFVSKTSYLAWAAARWWHSCNSRSPRRSGSWTCAPRRAGSASLRADDRLRRGSRVELPSTPSGPIRLARTALQHTRFVVQHEHSSVLSCGIYSKILSTGFQANFSQLLECVSKLHLSGFWLISIKKN